MKDTLIVIKKELTRFFTDYRMLAAMILPGILIYVIYSLMGPILSSNFTASSDYNYQVYVLNEDETYLNLLKTGYTEAGYQVTFLEVADEEVVKNAIKDESADLLIAFTSINDKLAIDLAYNSAKVESQTIYTLTNTMLTSVQVNPNDYLFTLANQNLATDEQTSSTFISMMLPFLLLIFLCTGVMSVAPESIAGERIEEQLPLC